MASESVPSAADGGRLGEAMAAYLRARDGGEAFDRAAWLAGYPELAPELEAFLAGEERLDRVAGPLRQALRGPAPGGPASEPLLPPGSRLGDFRIIKEVGRGGMGVVYEAEQVSLRRRVALKVLPLAATLDPKRLVRFQNEARAAGQLHHTNVVPVHAVGCERGLHYYAMQFIDGQTLAALIADLRRQQEPARPVDADGPPTADYAPAGETAPATPVAGLSTDRSGRGKDYYRAVARLGQQAAEALDYAHQVGVIHRDVKPANLMVDGKGNLWVTDFGLAQFQGDAGLTQTGDLVGTLRYMSPEQALAKRVAIDHRTDVYSLGATLYELLTLRPAFDGTDRQELLRQIAFEEPARPRRIEKSIPAELETIVLKALEKNPADRYATAQELADDLRRWLDHRPILARRPSLAQRLAKLARRHRAAVRAALLVFAVAMPGATALVWREKQRTETALIGEADQRHRADLKRQQARRAVEDMYTQVAERWLNEQPRMTEIQLDFLHKALAFYQEFAADEGADGEALADAARAWARVAQIQFKLGNNAEAAEAAREAAARWGRLATAAADQPEFRDQQARSLHVLGKAVWDIGQVAAGDHAYAEALRIEEELVTAFPGEPSYRREAASICYSMGGAAHDRGQNGAAATAFDRAVRYLGGLDVPGSAVSVNRLAEVRGELCRADVLFQTGKADDGRRAASGAMATARHLAAEFPNAPDWREVLVLSQNRLGCLLCVTAQFGDAERLLKEAVEGGKSLSASFPAVPRYKHLLAGGLADLGRLYIGFGEHEKAAIRLREAAKQFEELRGTRPGVVKVRGNLASAYENLAIALMYLHRHQEAEAVGRQALGVLIELCKDYPAVPRFQGDLANHYSNLANLQERIGRPRDAEVTYGQAIAVFEKLIAEHPDMPTYRHGLGLALENLSGIVFKRGDDARCVELVTRALDLYRSTLKVNSKDPLYRRDLRNCLEQRAILFLRAKDYRQAAVVADQLVPVMPNGPSYVTAADLLAECAELAARDPKLTAAERQALARGYMDRAKGLLTGYGRKALASASPDADYLNEFAWFLATTHCQPLRDVPTALKAAARAVERSPERGPIWNTLGVARYRAGDWAGAVEALNKSVQLRQGGDASDWLFLAMAQWRLGHPAEARTWHAKALKAMQKTKPNEELAAFRNEAAALLKSAGAAAPAAPQRNAGVGQPIK